MSQGFATASLISLCYTAVIFAIAWFAHKRTVEGKSVVSNPLIYSLSIAVYCTSWTFYGSVGKAATTGIDFLMIYLGPSLTAFAWMFILTRIVKISKDNNITSIADFISLRYGKSLWLGALVTIIAILGIMPYIALQIKAVSTTFYLISGFQDHGFHITSGDSELHIPSGLILAFILSIFSVIFGARKLLSSERHEGMVAAIAFESVIKIVSIFAVGIFVTYNLFDGFSDIFTKFEHRFPLQFQSLFTLENGDTSTDRIPSFTLLFLSMSAIMLLPRQFHVMVIENSDEKHIAKAMWLFPVYMFLINLFVMPIALGGILTTGSASGADFFVISLPLTTGHSTIAMLAFLGGLSAAAGMVIVESVTISTMLLNHIFMPIIVKFNPQPWFPILLINLKRGGIFLIIFLGYFYYRVVGDSYMLVNMGMISFSAAAQFLPAMIGGLYWRRGNKIGAVTGIFLGSVTWFYTLLMPSFSHSGWISKELMQNGLLGISLLKPTALFGMNGMDMWSHSLFWSMFFNISGYIICSILLKQNETEHDQLYKFITRFETGYSSTQQRETKRLSKPVTVAQFHSLLTKFIGEKEAQKAILNYKSRKESSIVDSAELSEFELPNLKRFTEKTLAGSVGAAAAGAIVESFLSDMGSRMESVYDIFSSVKSSLDQSREALYVRLKASEIINRTLDLQIIMDDLLDLILKEFSLDAAIIRLNTPNSLGIKSYRGLHRTPINENHWYMESIPYTDMSMSDKKPHVINDIATANLSINLNKSFEAGFSSFAHIPIFREGENPLGVISLYSRNIKGIFTEEFLALLASLAGQLAQAVTIVKEIEEKEKERFEKEKIQLEKAKIARDMEIARQIQLTLLPLAPPEISSVDIAGKCISAAEVGGDYYDFFARSDHEVEIVIADVSGHSVGSALIMAEVRTVLKALRASFSSTSSMLKNLNSNLYSDLTNSELFITMFYASYNNATGILTYSNAGHNRPMLHRADENSCIELDTDGLIIGVKQQVIFEEKSIELKSGDILLFYTDGLTEAENSSGEMFGTTKLCQYLSLLSHLSSAEIISKLYEAVSDFREKSSFNDDISMVVVKIL